MLVCNEPLRTEDSMVILVKWLYKKRQTFLFCLEIKCDLVKF